MKADHEAISDQLAIANAAQNRDILDANRYGGCGCDAEHEREKQESDLWRFGCDVIGRDALAGASREGFAPEGYTPSTWRSVTSAPRRYGFHATLKAPFRLRLDLDVATVIDTLAEFSRKFAPFDAGELTVRPVAMGHGPAFVALQPHGGLRELRSFESSVVRSLNSLRGFRDREPREPARLTPRQVYYLDAWRKAGLAASS